MSRIMCFDFGTKRMGIAVSDNLKMIATGLDTIHPKDTIEYLKNYMQKEVIDCFVVGLPKHLDNKLNEVEVQIKAFINLLKKHFPDIPIKRIDERFTSSMALQTMIEGGVKQKARRDKALIDKISATIILQSYMAQID